MGVSKNLESYSDIKAVLDRFAAASCGGAVECTTYQRAVRWRQRANAFRRLFAAKEAEGIADVPGYTVDTPYDLMVFSLTKGDSVVKVTFDKPPLHITFDSDEEKEDII